ncbi:MAG: SpoIIE family protein phosphatase [Prevotella sp.]|jgi:sigma-B regulation protein RsbU (phosphoserine phosphatase)|nr:SpoIIE family protein phosphatase [Prevotella sp.]
MVKILSVDDELDLELLLTQYFRRKIRKGEYEFVFAHNGLEALTMMLRHPDIEIVLSDINMPEMDGLTLLARINEMRNPALRVIMVSAYGDMGNIRQAMNNGAFDFATKPIDLDDLSVTIEKAIKQIEYIRQTQREHAQLEDLKGDLAVAGEIQQAILPRVFPPFPENIDVMDLAALMTPAKDVGGDFYDFFRIDPEHIGVVMADVSGKGIPAAIFMAVSRTLIRAIGTQGLTPEECITKANELLCMESANNMFVTVFYGIYNVKTGELRYCNGGHNAPCIIHSDGRTELMKVEPNFIVGALGGMTYKGEKTTLEKGETLLLYTDGVTEAVNPSMEEYGEQRMIDTLSTQTAHTCRETIDGLLQNVRDFAGEAEQSDDITILALKRLG